MAIMQDLEKFVASEAGQFIKNVGRTGNYMYKITDGHVKFFKAGDSDFLDQHHLTATEQSHLKNGGRLVLVYGCGYRLPISI